MKYNAQEKRELFGEKGSCIFVRKYVSLVCVLTGGDKHDLFGLFQLVAGVSIWSERSPSVKGLERISEE